MCFINNDRNNYQRPYAIGIIGPRGPVGPTGPQGPQGPQGEPGRPSISQGVYANAVNATIAPNAVAPVLLNTFTPMSLITVQGGVATLPPGSYLVNYFVSGTSTDDLSLSLNQNGTPISSITTSGTETETSSKSVLVNSFGGSTLSLTNTGTADITSSDVGYTIVKIS